MNETKAMNVALHEAKGAADRGEVPVGAVIVNIMDGNILAKAGNRMNELNDPTAHAEMLAIRAATSRMETPRLLNCDIYVTLEPCAMCATAIAFARIRKLIFGAYDSKSGGVEHGPRIFSRSTIHHKPEVIGGFQETDSAILLTDFFKNRRKALMRKPC